MKVKVGNLLPPTLLLFLMIAVWEGATSFFHVPSWLLPSPHVIAQALLSTPNLLQHTETTLIEAVAGFLIAVVVGIVTASVIAHSVFLTRGLLPYVVVLQSIPVVAIAPLLSIWFGFGLAPKVATAMIISFFPIVTNTFRGLKSVDFRMVEMMKSVNASTIQLFHKVEFPTALAFVFSAFKISIALSLIGAVVAEFYGGNEGLGYLVILSAAQLETPILFAAIVILAVIGIAFFVLMSALEDHFCHWREKVGSD